MLLGETITTSNAWSSADAMTRYGWGNSVLAFVGIVLGIPAPFALWRYGPSLRQKSKYAARD
jgi:hypothetical protein